MVRYSSQQTHEVCLNEIFFKRDNLCWNISLNEFDALPRCCSTLFLRYCQISLALSQYSPVCLCRLNQALDVFRQFSAVLQRRSNVAFLMFHLFIYLSRGQQEAELLLLCDSGL